MQDVASFSPIKSIKINTDKKVVLVYGHNGTGKSTIGRYLQNPHEYEFKKCNRDFPNSSDYQVLVYNTDFVEENFYQKESFAGIFTLGDTNVTAEKAIKDAEKELNTLEEEKQKTLTESLSLTQKESTAKKSVSDVIYKVKQDHDKKSLDFCMKGFKTPTENFVNKCLAQPLNPSIDYTYESLAKEADELNSGDAKVLDELPLISSIVTELESNPIFQEEIVSTSNGYMTELVNKLSNLTWVDQGRAFLPKANEKCPFCQQDLDKARKEQIEALFDNTYQEKKNSLENLSKTYSSEILRIKEHFNSRYFLDVKDKDFLLAKESLLRTIETNIKKIEKKNSSPSMIIDLKSSQEHIDKVNEIVEQLNSEIEIFNNKLKQKSYSLSDITKRFWLLTRSKFNNEIEAYNAEKEKLRIDRETNKAKSQSILGEINHQKKIIRENREKITSIAKSIENINNQLLSIGIVGFELKEHPTESNSYYICREGKSPSEHIYKSLSEGEKTLITFLYYLELCQGSEDTSGTTHKNKKILVIDDPISSLSQNYIYEIGALTHVRLVKGYEYAQIFIMTHSLYYYHEILKYLPSKQVDFEKKAYLYRVLKKEFSDIKELGRDEIQNDYQSYWQVVKDAKVGLAKSIVLPNMMRNILEYYFAFVHKQDSLSKALTELENEEGEYKAFFRYINRESHSDSVNINDFGEIDAQKFIDKFEDVFKRTGFEEHFAKMMDD